MRSNDYKHDIDDLEKNQHYKKENKSNSDSWSLEKSGEVEEEAHVNDQIQILPNFYRVQTQRAERKFNMSLKQKNKDCLKEIYGEIDIDKKDGNHINKDIEFTDLQQIKSGSNNFISPSEIQECFLKTILTEVQQNKLNDQIKQNKHSYNAINQDKATLNEDNEESKAEIKLSCGHTFCQTCIEQMLNQWIGAEGRVSNIKCLDSECEVKFTNRQIQQHIEPQLYEKYLRLNVKNVRNRSVSIASLNGMKIRLVTSFKNLTMQNGQLSKVPRNAPNDCTCLFIALSTAQNVLRKGVVFTIGMGIGLMLGPITLGLGLVPAEILHIILFLKVVHWWKQGRLTIKNK
ncbi:ibr domain containing protein [Stylonychia lemnae]|uniref:RBR-type E3 ubiquitin transferase n=1 Tax=Stylonychia lemnae TaxID=5949 RepID=A0A078AW54_STYLE|nr:ibr domain containing protein [Stylonychia lemnae]|eukprot:CDW85457.1 ibr domain containing protein [Stylonychia lemnae]